MLSDMEAVTRFCQHGDASQADSVELGAPGNSRKVAPADAVRLHDTLVVSFATTMGPLIIDGVDLTALKQLGAAGPGIVPAASRCGSHPAVKAEPGWRPASSHPAVKREGGGFASSASAGALF